MSRVESKNLFNFTLTGIYDDDVSAKDAEMMAMMGTKEGMEMFEKINELTSKDDVESNTEFVAMMRAMMEGMVKPMFESPTLKKAAEEVIEEKIKVPTSHDGKFDVPVFKYTPKKLQGDGKKHAAYIYSHGGGAIAIEASTYKPLLAYYAVECDAVVFNVDYRLAPETKCPNNVKDFYEVVKYVYLYTFNMGF